MTMTRERVWELYQKGKGGLSQGEINEVAVWKGVMKEDFEEFVKFILRQY